MKSSTNRYIYVHINRVFTEDDNESKGADIDALAPILNDVFYIQ
jgi:hypothetical protein